MRAYREMKKQGGAVRIDCYLPSEYKQLLEQLCKETNSSTGEGICYLLDFYFDTQEHTSLQEKNVWKQFHRLRFLASRYLSIKGDNT